MCTENRDCNQPCETRPTAEQLEQLTKIRIMLAINRQLTADAAEKHEQLRQQLHREHVLKAARDWVRVNLPSWLANHLTIRDNHTHEERGRLYQAVAFRLPGYSPFGLYLTARIYALPEPQDYTTNPPEWEHVADCRQGESAWWVDAPTGRRSYASSFEEALEAAALPPADDQADDQAKPLDSSGVPF